MLSLRLAVAEIAAASPRIKESLFAVHVAWSSFPDSGATFSSFLDEKGRRRDSAKLFDDASSTEGAAAEPP